MTAWGPWLHEELVHSLPRLGRDLSLVFGGALIGAGLLLLALVAT